ncbi:hypothetical protein BCR42DRAFT_414600 [Absidia repens]|uniref:RRM domain-containing protein n=1 Tax=Absidia repens TaxID=90262 RepID=A0A1X2II13_9FUNG|nr:hypothetical protein BCR42DRAFT_414600 [Absidia repens]
MSDRRVSNERRRSPPRSRSRSRSPLYERRESRYKSRSRSREPEVPEEELNPGDNLFVTGLSSKTSSAQLEDVFSKHGVVQKAEVMYDPHTRESRGFGFIQMQNAEDASRAMEAVHATDIDGRMVTVEKAKRAKPRTPTPGRYHGPPKRGGGRHMDRLDPRGANDYRYRHDSRYDRAPRYDRSYDRYMDRYEAPPYDRFERDRYSRYDRYERFDRRPPPPRYDPYSRPPRSPY